MLDSAGALFLHSIPLRFLSIVSGQHKQAAQHLWISAASPDLDRTGGEQFSKTSDMVELCSLIELNGLLDRTDVPATFEPEFAQHTIRHHHDLDLYVTLTPCAFFP